MASQPVPECGAQLTTWKRGFAAVPAQAPALVAGLIHSPNRYKFDAFVIGNYLFMLPFSTLTVKQLMVLKGCSYSTAGRHLKHLRDALQVDDVQLRHLATYWDCTVQELTSALQPNFKR